MPSEERQGDKPAAGDFQDKAVVITGGASGIGFALAKALGSAGAKIVIGEPQESRLKEAAAKLTGMGIAASFKTCDVAQPDSVAGLADHAWRTHQRVDMLINNAGIAMGRSRVSDAPLSALHKLFGVNFFGVWHGCAIFGKRFIAQGTPAAIYNVGSENSFFVAAPRIAAYVASKHAVLGLTEALREEMPDFIKVGLILPGFVRSELTAASAQFAMDADRFAQIVLRQIRAGAHFIVSHAYNVERIKPRYEELLAAYAAYAPRYEGDDEFDVRTLLARLAQDRPPAGEKEGA